MAPLIHQISETEAAWLAGLFDGEAFIGLVLLKNNAYSNGRYWAPRVRLHMTSEVTIDKIVSLLGGKKAIDKARNDCSQSYGWECPRGEFMLELLKCLQPYSVTKKKAITLMIAFVHYRLTSTISERRNSEWEETLAQEIRALTATTRQLRERKRANAASA